jgi:hypothetical protein
MNEALEYQSRQRRLDERGEPSSKQIKFLCVGMNSKGGGSYGTGTTFDEAADKYKELAGDGRFMCWMWVGTFRPPHRNFPSKAWVTAMGNIQWEDCLEYPILIQDNRLKGDRTRMPVEIGSQLT